jgi:hypothetical protein
MDTRARVTWLIFGMTNAVLFGVGLITVLTVPLLAANAALIIPLVTIASFALAFPLAWKIVPWMRARHEQRRSMIQK